MKQGWEIKKLGEVVNVINGRNQAAVISENGQYPIYGSAGNLMGYATDYLCEEGTTIIGRKGNISHPIYIEEKFWNVDTAFGLYPKNGYEPKFINYLCQTIDFKSRNRGTTIPSLVKSDLLSIDVPFISSLPEQQRIVSILDEAFAAITKAKANAEQNLKNAKELFESYLQGVFENGKEIWEEKTLDEVCEFRNGAAHEQHIDKNGRYILVNSKFISADGEKFKRTNDALAPLYVNDIAFVMSDVPNGKALAKCFLVDENDTYTLNQRIGAIKSMVFVPEFLVYQFNRNKYLLSFNNGENQTNLRKGDILKCPLWLPSKEEQQTIVRQLDALRAETQKLEAVYQKKIDDLEELKKSILQKAFVGELMSEPLINAD